MADAIYGLYFRRYAPFKKFGIPAFKGDTRTDASAALAATSRTYGCVRFSSYAILDQGAGSSGTEDANLVLTFLDRKATAQVSMSTVRSSEAGPALLSFSASTAGSNPLIPKSPSIDTTVNFRASWGAGTVMHVCGTVLGDDFPNLEVFLRCYRSRKSAMLVDGRTRRDGYTGPFTLFGSGRKLCSFLSAIPLSADGTFTADQTCLKTEI